MQCRKGKLKDNQETFLHNGQYLLKLNHTEAVNCVLGPNEANTFPVLTMNCECQHFFSYLSYVTLFKIKFNELGSVGKIEKDWKLSASEG